MARKNKIVLKKLTLTFENETVLITGKRNDINKILKKQPAYTHYWKEIISINLKDKILILRTTGIKENGTSKTFEQSIPYKEFIRIPNQCKRCAESDAKAIFERIEQFAHTPIVEKPLPNTMQVNRKIMELEKEMDALEIGAKKYLAQKRQDKWEQYKRRQLEIMDELKHIHNELIEEVTNG